MRRGHRNNEILVLSKSLRETFSALIWKDRQELLSGKVIFRTDFPGGSVVVDKNRWRRKWQPTPVFLPGKSQGQRSLMGYGPRSCRRVGCGLMTRQQYKCSEQYIRHSNIYV